MKITKLMTDDVITASPDSSLYDVAQLMREHDIGFLPIIYDRTLMGVITDRDLAIRGYADRRREDTQVKDIMTGDCVTVDKSASVNDVARVMAENQIRRVCITDDDKLIGVCAIGDLAANESFEAAAEFALGGVSEDRKKVRL